MTTAVEELHGVFQFADDLFDDNQVNERKLTIDMTYNPREIYSNWFEDFPANNGNGNDNDNDTEILIDTVQFTIPELYRRGEYEKCLDLCLERIKMFPSSPGILRDAAESGSLCLLKLKRPSQALPLLPLMTGVEEPGRLIVRSRVFFGCKDYKQCGRECRNYLNLRSGDYSMTMRLTECLINELSLSSSTIIINNENKLIEEIQVNLKLVENILIGYLDLDSVICNLNLKEKYKKDLSHLQNLKLKFNLIQ